MRLTVTALLVALCSLIHIGWSLKPPKATANPLDTADASEEIDNYKQEQPWWPHGEDVAPLGMPPYDFIDPEEFGYDEGSQEGEEEEDYRDRKLGELYSSDHGGDELDLSVLERWEMPGQVGGVTGDKAGGLYVFHRDNHTWDFDSFDGSNKYQKRTDGAISSNPLIRIDPKTGKVTQSWGAGRFYMPHGVTLDSAGNFWLTDVALHQVFKIPRDSKNFEPTLTLGVAFEPGHDDKHFCKPTGVAVASSGDFFVADGYCNTRVMKFNKEGKLLHSFGKDIKVVHSVALLEDLDMVCVADREDRRIKCYGAGLKNTAACGKFLYEITDPRMGRVFAIKYIDGELVALTGDTPGKRNSLFIIDVHDSQGEVEAVYAPRPRVFQEPHDFAALNNGITTDFYVGETAPNRLTKLGYNPNSEED